MKTPFKKSLKEIIYLCFCKIITLIFFKNARLIRLPIDIRGRKGIDFGKKITTGYHCRIESYSIDGSQSLHFGDNVQIGDFCHINARQRSLECYYRK